MSARRRDNRWLTLGEASRLLGVHRATLRAWADAGQVKSFRTPGGHRRFLASEIEALIRGAGERAVPAAADRFAQHLVARARQDLSALTHAGNAWLDAFPTDVRTGWRQSGRRLVGLAIQYVSRRQARGAVLDEGRAIGAGYGRDCAQRGLGLAGTVRAFLFFRESLLRATRPGLVERGQYDEEDARIHREMREFLDEVLFAMLDALEQLPRYLPAGGR
jgi:excisionase family DNA binding protein